ncbi:SEC-C metal-binding domain-containing protein [Falsiroseomonas sp. HC035]|uniref:SEC-C domain-containing protein n=1 Tax=Falsiroseomonas sp. HC035 TaxID=3390999 RepID=UPI003D30F961
MADSEKLTAENIASMTKYFARAERLRGLLRESLTILGPRFGPDFFEKLNDQIRQGAIVNNPTLARDAVVVGDAMMFIDYWHSALWVVLEGYGKLAALGVKDKNIDRLRSNPLTSRLKDYRDGIYHFDMNYHNKKTYYLLAHPNAYQWSNDLHEAFHEFFDKKWRENPATQGIPDPMDQYLLREQMTSKLRDSGVVTNRRDISRNAKCFCGSGIRYKHCHGIAPESS